jgi:hypothetical protein
MFEAHGSAPAGCGRLTTKIGSTEGGRDLLIASSERLVITITGSLLVDGQARRYSKRGGPPPAESISR